MIWQACAIPSRREVQQSFVYAQLVDDAPCRTAPRRVSEAAETSAQPNGGRLSHPFDDGVAPRRNSICDRQLCCACLAAANHLPHPPSHLSQTDCSPVRPPAYIGQRAAASRSLQMHYHHAKCRRRDGTCAAENQGRAVQASCCISTGATPAKAAFCLLATGYEPNHLTRYARSQ